MNDDQAGDFRVVISQSTDYMHQLLTHLTCQSCDGSHTDLNIGGFRCHTLLLNIATEHLTTVKVSSDPDIKPSYWGILHEIYDVFPYEMGICLKYIYGQQITLSLEQKETLQVFAAQIFSPLHFEDFLLQFTEGKNTFGRFGQWLDLLKEMLENPQVCDVESCMDMCFLIEGRQVRCHKCVLSAMSPTYYGNNLLNTSAPVIPLDNAYPELTYYGVSHAVKYMYGCELLVEHNADKIFEILNAATYFKMELLRFKLLMLFQMHSVLQV